MLWHKFLRCCHWEKIPKGSKISAISYHLLLLNLIVTFISCKKPWKVVKLFLVCQSVHFKRQLANYLVSWWSKPPEAWEGLSKGLNSQMDCENGSENLTYTYISKCMTVVADFIMDMEFQMPQSLTVTSHQWMSGYFLLILGKPHLCLLFWDFYSAY